MKTDWFKMRISKRRLDKLRLYAAEKDKSMTQIIEELIDNLTESKKHKATEA